jgi:hypothetical protein
MYIGNPVFIASFFFLFKFAWPLTCLHLLTRVCVSQVEHDCCFVCDGMRAGTEEFERRVGMFSVPSVVRRVRRGEVFLIAEASQQLLTPGN